MQPNTHHGYTTERVSSDPKKERERERERKLNSTVGEEILSIEAQAREKRETHTQTN